jgi:hypothetical protein
LAGQGREHGRRQGFHRQDKAGGGTGGVDRHPRRLRAAQRRVDPGRTEEIRDLAALDAVYATQARGPGTLRAYRSAWRQYDAWCARLGLPALSGDPQLVGMYTQTV